MKTATLNALLEAIREQRAVVLATRLPGGAQAVLSPADSEGSAAPVGEHDWPLEAAREALNEDRSIMVPHGDDQVFLRPYNPPVRLVVVGAAHIASPLASMAATAGIAVQIVDPRSAFATEERFPAVELIRAWPMEALSEMNLDARTAVVTLTHDEKLDDPALITALGSKAFYIGALGSTRTHAKRLERLRDQGFAEEDLARIHAPIGLDIGAQTPAEIAVAILAELLSCLRRRPSP